MSTDGNRSAEAQKEKEKECCVLCGKVTEIGKEQLVSGREYYIEGAGQLCRKCYRDLYVSCHNDNMVRLVQRSIPEN